MNPNLPQLADTLFLTDGGCETTLVFHEGIDLPHFAAFHLLRTDDGRETLKNYYRTYAALAREHGVGFILEAPSWRANPDWGTKLGYSTAELADANRESVELMREIREEFQTPDSPMVISGCLGPRGDGYQPGTQMSAADARDYHAPQIRTLRDAGADFVSGMTLNYLDEALGMVEAAAALGIPSVISFTLETDGNLPSGQTLRHAIETIDAQATILPAYYLINCAHPTHFADTLKTNESWVLRIRGLRANASCRSHAELDSSPDLDAGNPEELAGQYRELREKMPQLTILGGCCGTDDRHISAICGACIHPEPALGHA